MNIFSKIKIWIRNKRKIEICSICLDPMKKYQTNIITRCGHKYHLVCIREWLYFRDKNYCPYCRSRLQWVNPNPFLAISGY